jgi:hypothetical protein
LGDINEDVTLEVLVKLILDEVLMVVTENCGLLDFNAM